MAAGADGAAPAPAGWAMGHISVKDEALWAQYRSQVPATLEPWGGELVMRGKQRAVVGGSYRHADVVVLKFPDALAAAGWFASPAYQALIPLRQAAADVDLVLFEG